MPIGNLIRVICEVFKELVQVSRLLKAGESFYFLHDGLVGYNFLDGVLEARRGVDCNELVDVVLERGLLGLVHLCVQVLHEAVFYEARRADDHSFQLGEIVLEKHGIHDGLVELLGLR